jgi:hypothetical protein
VVNVLPASDNAISGLKNKKENISTKKTDGKGQKDRTVPIPETIVPELKRHLRSVIDTHQEDLKAGYAGAFLPSLLEKKYIY